MPDWPSPEGQFINVLDYGADPTFTNDCTTQIQAAIDAVQTRGTVYFPGAFKISAALTTPANTYVKLLGGSLLGSFIGTTNPTANIFTIGSSGCTIEGLWLWAQQTTTVGGGTLSGTPQTITVGDTTWFPTSGTVTIGLTTTTWTTMTYTSKTATSFVGCTGSGVFSAGAPVMVKTAGAAIDLSNFSMETVRDVRVENHYNGIIASGVMQTVTDCEIFNMINFGVLVNVANAGPVFHNIVMDNTYTSKPVSGIEIQACGVVMGTSCQFIRAQHGCRVNPTVAGCYSVNFTATYFDNCITTGFNVIAGTQDVQRVKLGQCSFSSISAGSGVVINKASAAEIDISQSNAYLCSGDGFVFTACADFKLTGCRSAQNGGDGVDITASTPAPSFRITDCIIGAEVGGLTGNAGAGIRVGTGTYASYSIITNDLSGNTAAGLIDGGTVADPNQRQIIANTGLAVAPKPNVSLTTIVNATETVMTGWGGRIYLPANSLLVGTTFLLNASGNISATTPTVLARIRLGTAGTASDTAVCATAAQAATSGSGWAIVAIVTIQTIGSGGTAIGNIAYEGTTPGRTAQVTTVAVNTTVANYLSFTLTAGTSAITLRPVNVAWQVINQG